MKTIFIINPKAGQGKGLDKLVKNIGEAAENLGLEGQVDIYMTKSQGDAEVFARKVGEKLTAEMPDEKMRLIACGGDGTFSEVVNGAIDFPNISVGVYPIGTGNDFRRNFPEAGDFLSLEAQLLGETKKLDCIRYTGVIDGVEKTGYGANMFNIGFDCNVADLTADMKQKPFISGSMAYLAGVGVTFFKKKTTDLLIEMDGEVVHDGPLLLTSIANGCYCGGGVKSNPYADLTEGEMDVNMINDISRLQFLNLFPKYSKGTHMELEGIDHLIKHRKCRTMKITPKAGMMRLCTDGEITDCESVELTIVHEGFNFNVPKVI